MALRDDDDDDPMTWFWVVLGFSLLLMAIFIPSCRLLQKHPQPAKGGSTVPVGTPVGK